MRDVYFLIYEIGMRIWWVIGLYGGFVALFQAGIDRKMRKGTFSYGLCSTNHISFTFFGAVTILVIFLSLSSKDLPETMSLLTLNLDWLSYFVLSFRSPKHSKLETRG